MSLFTQASTINVDGDEYRFSSTEAAIEVTQFLSATPPHDPDTFILAVVSGDFTADGDTAMADKIVQDHPELFSA